MSITRGDYFIEYRITESNTARTAFPFEFPVKESTHIHCSDITPGGEDAADIVTPISAGYFSISAAPAGFDEGGYVALLAPLATGHVLRIERKTPTTQEKTFSNQDRLRPEEIEDALDRIVMWIQENGLEEIWQFVRELSEKFYEKTKELEDADAGMQRQIDKLLDSSNAQANALASLQKIVSDIAEDVRRIDAAKMPKAPDDGKHYVGSGGIWIEVSAADITPPEPPTDEIGGIFIPDVDGDAIIIDRVTYEPNAVWKVTGDEIILSETSQPGDTDGTFIIDADGDAVLVDEDFVPPDPPDETVGEIFMSDADGDVAITDRVTYTPNSIWDVLSDGIALSETSQTGDTDGVFVIDADGDAVLE